MNKNHIERIDIKIYQNNTLADPSQCEQFILRGKL